MHHLPTLKIAVTVPHKIQKTTELTSPNSSILSLKKDFLCSPMRLASSKHVSPFTATKTGYSLLTFQLSLATSLEALEWSEIRRRVLAFVVYVNVVSSFFWSGRKRNGPYYIINHQNGPYYIINHKNCMYMYIFDNKLEQFIRKYLITNVILGLFFSIFMMKE